MHEPNREAAGPDGQPAAPGDAAQLLAARSPGGIGAVRPDRGGGHDGRPSGLPDHLGCRPAVIEGKDGVLAFYNSVGESVLWNSDDWLAVADWGIADELTFHQLAPGSALRPLGYDVDDDQAMYHVSSRQAFIWPYDERGRLAGRTCTRTRPACASSRSARPKSDHARPGTRDPPRTAGQAARGARRQVLGPGHGLRSAVSPSPRDR